MYHCVVVIPLSTLSADRQATGGQLVEEQSISEK